MTDDPQYKELASRAIDTASSELHEISMKIHDHPELAYEEVFAHDLLASYLENKGFKVERNYVVKTGFRAVYGSGHPIIALLSEYDALPSIGHACGHNLIAVASVAAGIALMNVIGKKGGNGTVWVLGTPAEEAGGGKVDFLREGVFSDVDIAMMCHPYQFDSAYPKILALQELSVEFHGKEAHASVAPWDGINALDAMVMAYNSVSVMRQQFRTGDQVHGVITNGGVKPNIIPAYTSAYYYLRSTSAHNMPNLKEKILNCFKAAETATGATLKFEWIDKPYDDLSTNPTLADLYVKNLANLGFVMPSIAEQQKVPGGSTDMGNVTYVVPGIHPSFSIPATNGNHTVEFAEAAGSAEGHQRTWRTAKALAFTAVDVLCVPHLLQQIKDQFQAMHQKTPGMYTPNF